MYNFGYKIRDKFFKSIYNRSVQKDKQFKVQISAEREQESLRIFCVGISINMCDSFGLKMNSLDLSYLFLYELFLMVNILIFISYHVIYI